MRIAPLRIDPGGNFGAKADHKPFQNRFCQDWDLDGRDQLQYGEPQMNENPEVIARYRFAAFGVSGTITLKTDGVHSCTRSYLGWWEQTMPLEHLSPNYATLTATPPTYIWAWIFGVLFAWIGIYGIIWGIAAYPQKLVGVFLLLSCVWFMWYLYRLRKTEWIIFLTARASHSLSYTRQGPDEKMCDEFTRQVVDLIDKTCHSAEAKPSSVHYFDAT